MGSNKLSRESKDHSLEDTNTRGKRTVRGRMEAVTKYLRPLAQFVERERQKNIKDFGARG